MRALNDVSLTVNEGEFVAVVGTSGSGKSTLLNMIGGLDRPTSGKVLIRGKNLLKMKDEELTVFRRRNIGFVFQNYNLLPILNVYENITSTDVILLMQSISRQFHQTTIMITHNEEIAQMADRIIRIEDGRVISGGVGYAC